MTTHLTEAQERELITAARAVIERWDSPAWKDVLHTAIFINRMRNAIDINLAAKQDASTTGAAGEVTADRVRRLAENWADECVRAGYVTTVQCKRYAPMVEAINALAASPVAQPDAGAVPGAVWYDGSVSLIRRGTEDDYCARKGARRIYFGAAARAKATQAVEPVAWLFECRKPGQRLSYASVCEDDTQHWPVDQWTSIVKTPLVRPAATAQQRGLSFCGGGKPVIEYVEPGPLQWDDAQEGGEAKGVGE